MKKIITKPAFAMIIMVLIFTGSPAHSQVGRNEKGLLWEITGKGMTRPSYLYGTMHVSNKIAFNLSDSFFSAINLVDIVSLEINDEEFIREMATAGLLKYYFDYDEYDYYSGTGGFYNKAFRMKFPDPARFFDQTYLHKVIINHLLYRFDDEESDYEENTYLDMYVYQIGKKLNKKMKGLETYEEFLEMRYKASLPTDENQNYRYRRGRTERDIMEKAYRNGEVYIIDSLSNLNISENNRKYIIVERNKNFARRIDSFIRSNQAIFAAFGAAHLGGDEGVISLLRKEGYNVRPVSMAVTRKGQKTRDKYEKIIYPVRFTNYVLPDSLVSVNLPGLYLEHSSASNVREYFYPDLANGSYFSILRINTFASLYGKSGKDLLASIDSILYFNIPGKIISKKEVKKNGYPGIEVLNMTRRGDYQRYAFYITPMEIFIFKMNGSEDYLKSYGNDFFNSINFSGNKNGGLVACRLSAKGLTVNMPKRRSMISNSDESSAQKLLIQSFDEKKGNYYFLMKASLNDYRYIEEDTFELNYMTSLFCEQFDLEKDTSYFLLYKNYPAIDFVTGKKKKYSLYGRMVIKGPDYYLLGILTPSVNEAENYLNSFDFVMVNYLHPFENISDTFMHFSVIKPDDRTKYEKIDDHHDRLLTYYRSKFKPKNKTYSYNYYGNYNRYREDQMYYRESGEQLRFRYDNYDKYDVSMNKDSFWKNEIKYLNRNGTFIENTNRLYEKDSCVFLDLELTDTNSARKIFHRLILKGTELYTLSFCSDTLSKPGKYIESVFETFRPVGRTDTVTVYTDRLEAFISDVKGDTNSQKTALENVYSLKPDSSQLSRICDLLKGMGSTDILISLRSALLKKLAVSGAEKIIPFLEDYYYRVSDTANLEFSILLALSGIKSTKAAASFLKLINFDLPLGNYRSIEDIFESLSENKEMAAALYPELLKFSRYPDYQDEIYKLLARLVKDKKISKNDYSREIPIICQDAIDEAKRTFAKNDNDYYSDYYSGYESDYPSEYFPDESRYSYVYDRDEDEMQDIEAYIAILMPFYETPKVRKFFDKLMKTGSGEMKMEVCVSMIEYGKKVSDSLCNYFASNRNFKIDFYNKLKKINKLEYFNHKYINQEDFIRAILYDGIDKENDDSIVFISKIMVNVKGNTGYLYYFKRKNPKTGNWYIDYAGLQPKDSSGVSTAKYIIARNQSVFTDNKDSKAVPSDSEINRVMKESQKKIRLIGRKRASKNYYESDY